MQVGKVVESSIERNKRCSLLTERGYLILLCLVSVTVKEKDKSLETTDILRMDPVNFQFVALLRSFLGNTEKSCSSFSIFCEKCFFPS